MKDARSGLINENIQEVVDAAVSAKHALAGFQNQYQTPEWLAKALVTLLPREPYSYLTGNANCASVVDPQGAGGHLVKAVKGYGKVVFELDNRFKKEDDENITRITGNCVRVGELLDELYSGTRFGCIVSNPPFGIRWKTKDGSIDSTEWTWQFIQARLAESGFGFIISNVDTLRRLGVHTHRYTYLFQEFPAGGIWENCNVKLGVAHFQNAGSYWQKQPLVEKVWDHVPTEMEIEGLWPQVGPCVRSCRPYHTLDFHAMEKIDAILSEERSEKSKWNVYLGKDDRLRTYLSTYSNMKLKRDDIAMLTRVQNCHPLSLTVEKETRQILKKLVDCGVYTVEPAAKAAINAALDAVKSQACPIRPVTDFELVAYGGEEEKLVCLDTTPRDPESKMRFTKGKSYDIRTATYSFLDAFTKKVLTYGDEEGGEPANCWLEEHNMQLTGQDRFIELNDDAGHKWRFMDRPPYANRDWCLSESLLWKIFEKPKVPTVAEALPEVYERNLRSLEMHALMSGFDYFPGQHGYIARIGCKDYALISADVGCGKTLVALSLLQVKSPRRTLIIAPQGTMRSSGDEDEVDYQPSQWVSEIRRFAPAEPVFQLFSMDDYRSVLRANGGEFPPGVYISYPQAMWLNGSLEFLPGSWAKQNEEKMLCSRLNIPFDENAPKGINHGVGSDKDGIRCVVYPSLATVIATEQGEWDMVIVDESHLCCNLDAKVTRNLLRLQPKYRYALTATPIPNYINNIFSLMGWLCVPNWHKGEVLNTAWPYGVDDEGRFKTTFMCTEIDKTVQDRARGKGDRAWRQKGVKKSPIISSPARLLKLLKPNMAYISKEECNPDQAPCEVTDVRVPLGADQQIVYEHWLNRGNMTAQFPNPLTRALAQLQRLRGICASPSSCDYRTVNIGTKLEPKWFSCTSDFNAKTMTVIQLIRDRLAEGEQVVVVSARCGQSTEIQLRLAEANVPTARIDSTVSADMHAAEANRFKRGDARVMFMGIKCAQGHSFDKCRNLIIASLEWSYGSLHQAKGRVWRLTSKKKVRVWCVLHENTIEELLFDRVATKQDAATICLHGKRVARDYHEASAAEVLAEHIVNYKATDGKVLSEADCEAQWPELRRQLVLAYNPNQLAA